MLNIFKNYSESNRLSYGEALQGYKMSAPHINLSKAYRLLEESEALLSLLKEFQLEVSESIKYLEEHEVNDEEYENISRMNQVMSDLLDVTGEVYEEANDIYGKYHNNHIADYGRII